MFIYLEFTGKLVLSLGRWSVDVPVGARCPLGGRDLILEAGGLPFPAFGA